VPGLDSRETQRISQTSTRSYWVNNVSYSFTVSHVALCGIDDKIRARMLSTEPFQEIVYGLQHSEPWIGKIDRIDRML
jgi:hypothetical protein